PHRRPERPGVADLKQRPVPPPDGKTPAAVRVAESTRRRVVVAPTTPTPDLAHASAVVLWPGSRCAVAFWPGNRAFDRPRFQYRALGRPRGRYRALGRPRSAEWAPFRASVGPRASYRA